MKKRIVVALAVLFIGLLISGCATHMEIATFVAEKYPNAEVTFLYDNPTLYFVSYDDEILLVRYIYGGDTNSEPTFVLGRVDK